MNQITRREIIQIVDACQTALTDVKDYLNGDNPVAALYNLNRVFDNIGKASVLTRTLLSYNQTEPL